MSASNSQYLFIEEIGDEVLFIIWAAWQYLRIIMLIKNQKKAKDSAANIIEFSEVMEDNTHKLELQLDEKMPK